MAKVTSLQGQISDLRGQQTTAQKNAANTETQQGLFANLSALNQIADGNTTIVFVWWLLFALFTLLGCAPAIVKTLIILGPQNVDELANAPEVFVVKVPVKRETLIAWQRGTALPHRPQA